MPMSRLERMAAREARFAARKAIEDSDAPEQREAKAKYQADILAASYGGKYTFSKTWFWRQERNNEKTCRQSFEEYILPRRGEIRRYLEIGCCEGQSFLWMLHNVLNRKGDFAHGIDPYTAGRRKHQEQFSQHKATFQKNIETYRETATPETLATIVTDFSPSQLALARMVGARQCSKWDDPRGTAVLPAYDMAFVDGDHRGGECLVDCCLSFVLLRLGGLLIVDDMRKRWFRQRPFVLEGVNGFMAGFETRYEVLYREKNQIGFVRVE